LLRRRLVAADGLGALQTAACALDQQRSQVTGAALFFAPLVLLGFPVPYVLAVLGLNLFFQFWLHTELIGRFPMSQHAGW